ncbi:MAG TPA: hypothetical protein DCF87_02180 [Opitutae bacterium]|nr:hypothetical protein [Opitutae bacterium]
MKTILEKERALRGSSTNPVLFNNIEMCYSFQARSHLPSKYMGASQGGRKVLYETGNTNVEI